MDDDFDDSVEETPERDALDVGSTVIVHTPESYETGILLGSGEAGIRLRVTHRVVRIEPSLSEKEELQAAAVVEEMNWLQKYRYAMNLLVTRGESVTQLALCGRDAVEAMVLEDGREYLLSKKPTVEALKPLTRPVSTFLPWQSVEKIVSFAEWEEEQLLRPLAASLSGKTEG